MNAGKLSTVDSDSNDLESFYNELSGGDTPFDSFAETLIVEDRIDIENGNTAYTGQAALEQIDEVYNQEITESGEIKKEKELQKTVNITEFLFVPDLVLLIDNSAGDFLYPMLNRNTDHSVFEAEIDLHGYLSELEDVQHWKIGFEQRTDGAENGVLHGHQVLNDSEIGDILGKANKNQVGVEHPIEGDSAKVFATKSGYLEIYQPDMSIREFVEYIENNLIRSLRIK